MTHLSPEEIVEIVEMVDIAEGARPNPAHLASCATCRQELAEMRALMGAVADVDVPEPSPLFWDHLSSRVKDAVAGEAPPLRTRFERWEWVLNAWSRPLAAPVIAAFAAAALGVAVVMFSRGAMVAPERQVSAPTIVAAAVDAGPLVDANADPSFSFVADLTTDMNMDTAIEAGLVSDGSADHAVSHLNEGELRELAKLLTEEIAHAQAS